MEYEIIFIESFEKSLPVTEKVILFNGECKAVSDIEVGDALISSDGNSIKIKDYKDNKLEVFRIKTSRGRTILVSEKHMVSVKCRLPSIKFRKARNSYVVQYFDYNTFVIKSKSYKVRTGAEKFMISLPPKGSFVTIDFKTFRERINKKYYRDILFCSHTKFNFKSQEDLDIDPYFLGLWLGDGTSECPQITNIDKEIIDYIYEYAKKLDQNISVNKIRYTFVSRTGKRGTNKIKNFLKKNNLINNKHIPKNYLFTTRENRLKLLAGLIDTDGYYDRKGKCFEIVQKNIGLSIDICFLVWSLGFYVDRKTVEKTCTNSSNGRVKGLYERMLISGEGLEKVPVLVPRKQAKIREQIKNALCEGIVDVKSIGIKPCKSFLIENNQGLILKDFLVI